MTKKKIAIIGGGGAGLAAAWRLHALHDIKLFEYNDYVGGHAYSHEIESPEGEKARIDMGVDYFNERLGPNLCALLKHLNIATFVAPLSMRFHFPEAFWENNSFRGALHGELKDEFNRFQMDMSLVSQSSDPRYLTMRTEDFLTENGYSNAFRYRALVPLMTIFSGCSAPSLEYNLTYTAKAFELHLLSFFSAGYWRKAKGGIRTYIDRICGDLGDRIVTNVRIKEVERANGTQVVVHEDGSRENFDWVVFATHADVTLGLLKNPSKVQREILGAFEYNAVESHLHQDSGLLSSKDISQYCEYRLYEGYERTEAQQVNGQLSRISNNLSEYAGFGRPIIVTFDPKKQIAEPLIDNKRYWKLPKLRPHDFVNKRRYSEIQGVEGLYYCGLDTTLTGHEGSIVSGYVIANKFGAPHIFSENKAASDSFQFIKSLMGF